MMNAHTDVSDRMCTKVTPYHIPQIIMTYYNCNTNINNACKSKNLLNEFIWFVSGKPLDLTALGYTNLIFPFLPLINYLWAFKEICEISVMGKVVYSCLAKNPFVPSLFAITVIWMFWTTHSPCRLWHNLNRHMAYTVLILLLLLSRDFRRLKCGSRGNFW